MAVFSQDEAMIVATEVVRVKSQKKQRIDMNAGKFDLNVRFGKYWIERQEGRVRVNDMTAFLFKLSSAEEIANYLVENEFQLVIGCKI